MNITVNELAKIINEHTEWRIGSGGKCANLSGADLSGADLRCTNLSGADLRWADLSGAKLNWISAQGAKWPKGQEVYSAYGIGTLRVVHYRPATDTVWAGCWEGTFAQLEAELPRVIAERDNLDRAKVEYDAMLVYFRALARKE